MLRSGTIPSGSGVSSSAALVVSSTLAFLSINNKLGELTQGELVELCVENERRVGVNSGGYVLNRPYLHPVTLLLLKDGPRGFSTLFPILSPLHFILPKAIRVTRPTPSYYTPNGLRDSKLPGDCQ